MRYLTATVAVLMTSVWLGGLITLAAMVMAVFMASGLERETAGRATSAMFIWFGRGQLIVGALALIAVFVGYLQNRGGISIVLFAMLGLGAIGAVAFSMYFVPRIEALRLAGQAESVEFRTLHKQSEQLMKGLTAAILVAALMLPAFCRALLAPKPKSDSLPA
jgi:hypothetical protein